MAVIEERRDGTMRLKFTDALTIYEATDCRERLLGSLEGGGDVELDLSETTGCDAAGLQLLLALRKSAGRLGRPVRVTDASPAVSGALSAAGMDPGEIEWIGCV